MLALLVPGVLMGAGGAVTPSTVVPSLPLSGVGQ
jgi:hypothetical protein